MDRATKVLAVFLVLLGLITFGHSAEGAGVVKSDLITLNVDKVELKGFILLVSKILNLNVLLDKQVSGEVTVHVTNGMSKPQLRLLLDSVLEMNRLTSVENNGYLKIVPRIAANGGIGGISGENIVTSIYNLLYISPTKAAAIITPLLSRDGKLITPLGLGMIIITDSGVNIKKMYSLLQVLDSSSANTIRVIQLKNVNADVAALSVKTLYQENEVRVIANTVNNTLILVGARSAVTNAVTMMKAVDLPPTPVSLSRVELILVEHTKADNVLSVLSTLPSLTKEVEIAVDKIRNAIVLSGPEGSKKKIRLLISKLDTPRQQILVEMIIVEVAGDTSLAFGIDWVLNNSPTAGGGVGAGNVAIGDQLLDTGKSLVVGLFTGNPLSFGGILKALKVNTEANILSVPSVLVLSNEEARLSVGQNVPFVTGSQGGTQGANPFQTIERKDVGLSLVVTPRALGNGDIELIIEQEISSISPSTIASDIITNKRSLKTIAVAEDGGILVLGGLVQNSDTDTTAGIPLLGDIPFAGRLFAQTENKTNKVNLMIFIHPTIITHPQELTGERLMTTERLFPNMKGLLYLPE